MLFSYYYLEQKILFRLKKLFFDNKLDCFRKKPTHTSHTNISCQIFFCRMQHKVGVKKKGTDGLQI